MSWLGWTHIWCVLLGAWAAMAAVAGAATDAQDTAALVAVKAALSDPQGSLSNWKGDDPCGLPWTGVFCEADAGGVSHVTELRLMQMGLGGTLAGEVGGLQQLKTLNVMWNDIGGSLPASIGNLSFLELLLVSGNNLGGPLPAGLGGLSAMVRFQIDSNSFSGAIPGSFTALKAVQHLHMNNNSLSDSIPSGLGSLPAVVHIILDNNQLTGPLPADLLDGSSPTLQIVQVDNNPLDAQTIPASLGAQLTKVSLRNCNLRGSVPGLAVRGGGAMSSLEALDLRDNELTGWVPDLSGAPNLTTVALSGNLLAQNASDLPSLAELPRLQALLLADNRLNGTLVVARLLGTSPIAGPLLVDLQNNSLTALQGFVPPNVTLFLSGNLELCTPGGLAASLQECQAQDSDGYLQGTAHPSGGTDCQKDCSLKAVAKSMGDQCLCLFPVTAGLRLKSPSFSFFESYRSEFEGMVAQQLTELSGDQGLTKQSLGAEQVHVRNYSWSPGPRLAMDVQIFPDDMDPGGQFKQAEADELFSLFANWKVVDSTVFGPYELLSWDAGIYGRRVQQSGSRTGLSWGAVAGIVVAATVASGVAAGLLGLYYHRRRYPGPPLKRMVMGGGGKGGGKARTLALLNVTGVQAFSLDDMCIATEGFASWRKIGQGGYGKVYSGALEDGQKVAIKRAQEGSLQGSREFYTEIELLSRVHHRNLVRLVGFCDDEGEQMLVYEFVSGGTVREYLSPSSTLPPLSFQNRLRIALGSARGIAYLHNEASPPIFHRDIKASNILLDDKGNAKVADFGLSKLAPVTDLDGSNPAHVSTVVKGTPGYLDPEYFLTHKLTDKSDVYSFGVVLLELITGMQPISHGKNIVREVSASYQAGRVLAVVDTRMGPYPSEALEPLVRLALACCHDNQEQRPSILEVVRDLDSIWRNSPWGAPDTPLLSSDNPPTSTSTSTTTHKQRSSPPNHDDSFADATDIPASPTFFDMAPR